MDLWCVHVKNANAGSNLLGYSFREISVGKKRAFLSLIPRKRPGSRGFDSSVVVVRALAKKNDGGGNSGKRDGSAPSPGNGDCSEPDSSDGSKHHETASQKPRHDQDWRSFRALLFAREQAEKVNMESQSRDGLRREINPLGAKWAHPMHVPESGCVLVAREKLDGVRTFERTVVLLLRSGTRHPQEGPFGVVINRPLNKKIKHMNPSNINLATTFWDCSLHFGGPLEASMFLLKTSEKSRTSEKSKLPGFEEVIPGLCFGARNSLDEAAALVKKGVLKPQDFRFFMGYAGWQFDQLQEEIESDYWYVASCSANLISSVNATSGLWEEILQLMGGPYSELSRKPKQDL